jgi:DNA repair protein SbcD/Mre11
MKFIHAADIHLDSPLRGLERYEGAPVEAVRSATRDALVNLVQTAIDESVDLVLIAGDLYDGDWKDYNTGLFLVAQLRRLHEAGIRVLLISGNHDAASRITKALRWPESVTVFSTSRPETVLFDDLEVAVHGQGYASQAVTCDLSVDYPEPVPGCFNIGLLHTSADGREGHEPYAPCTVPSLVARGYDYWALGHVHQREVLHLDPWIVFPGNLQGRHVREAGAKGATLVTVEDRRVVSVDHVELDVLRWAVCEVDVSAAESPLDVIDLVVARLAELERESGDRVLAARVRIVGRTPAHEALARDPEHWVNELRAAALGLAGSVWLEKVVLATGRPVGAGGDGGDGGGGPLDDLLRSLRRLVDDPASLDDLVGEFADLRGKLPPEYRMGADAIDLGQGAGLAGRLASVEQLLASRLGGGEGER